jgi:rhodanese-related sulfurtransferase
MAAGEDIYLVDIRTPGEIIQAAIPDAVYLPMHLLPLRMNELPRDKDVVLYCRSGARSYHACLYLAQQGFNNAINLRGGIIAWARHGFPIEPGRLA